MCNLCTLRFAEGGDLSFLSASWLETTGVTCSNAVLQIFQHVLIDLPGLAFFTTYALLVLFWAEIYYQVRFGFGLFWYCSVTAAALIVSCWCLLGTCNFDQWAPTSFLYYQWSGLCHSGTLHIRSFHWWAYNNFMFSHINSLCQSINVSNESADDWN